MCPAFFYISIKKILFKDRLLLLGECGFSPARAVSIEI
ncbi:hypothetical protein Cabys_1032 [Caldithrix abyssi DSM 13497]|uniref:Uncharacterized protein n=1 Tax=Caldithrix abyssi DSM 13497 TaxID=880073 RepID=A0A1J1C522_CALAY|nr:hypothetical protein Cabys_1032 [Caldithrix abyssi DSM 13497]